MQIHAKNKLDDVYRIYPKYVFLSNQFWKQNYDAIYDWYYDHFNWRNTSFKGK